ncbi:hypothetical protein KAH37_03015 [bacterium]|nr:hypothetical protein [bacterium]
MNRTIFYFFLFLLLATTVLQARQPMDFSLYRLGNPNTYPASGTAGWSEADDPTINFKKMSTQLAATIAPIFFGEADSGGMEKFQLSLGYSMSKLAINENYWQHSLNDEPNDTGISSAYHSVDLMIRKGFPFGLTLHGNVRYYILTEFFSGGVGVEYTINEGLRVAPDVSLGMNYTGLFNGGDMNMHQLALRLKISKSFVVANELLLTPYIAYSHLFSWAYSNRIGGYYDYSQQAGQGAVYAPKGDPFYFDQILINVDRLALGFRWSRGVFGMQFEAIIPFNAYKNFSLNGGIFFNL